MQHSIQRLAGFILAASLLAGCGGSPVENGTGASSPAGGNFGWFGIPSAVKLVIETVHEGTGWVLNKSEVSVALVGEPRPAGDSDTFIADFRITVAHGPNSFETTAKDVPCDKDGIPTEESVTKLREAVEDIKVKIKRLQN
jgi:hypothetical protein